MQERKNNMKTHRIICPDDWHLHLRDGAVLTAVIEASANWCKRAIIMPNLVPPVTTSDDAEAYRNRILHARGNRAGFTPLMVLYLTEQTDPADVVAGFQAGIVSAVKLYPAGATTNSASGVRDMHAVFPVLEAMQRHQIPLLIHGEVTDPEIDIFDREAVFIDRVLIALRAQFPELKIVLEHITTSQAAQYVLESGDYQAATVTPHHLIINRNAILAGGIRPHYYCLPVAKRETHRQALISAVMQDSGKLFLGTDSAPHLDSAKLQPCGCAGIFNAPNTLACLAQLFENHHHLDKLEAFCSIYGPQFYGLEINTDTLVLNRHDTVQPVPKADDTDEGQLTVFDPQMDIYWSVAGIEHKTI